MANTNEDLAKEIDKRGEKGDNVAKKLADLLRGEEVSEVKKHILEDIPTEIHMIGEWVGVRWNLNQRKVRKDMEGEDGKTYTWNGVVYDRDGPPHITFPDIRERGDEVWLDDDDTISGGITVEEAEEVMRELAWAIEYIKGKGWEA